MASMIRRYHRGEPDSRDVPDVQEEGFAFPCPRCGFEFVHVKGARTLPGPYDGRLTAEIGLICENGCVVSVVFGNYKGNGYHFWTEGAEWLDIEEGALPEHDPDFQGLLEGCKKFEEIHETSFDILEENMASELKGTTKQIRWLKGLCNRASLGEEDLVYLGVHTGRLHPRRLNMEGSGGLGRLTRLEVGSLMAFVGFLNSRAADRQNC